MFLYVPCPFFSVMAQIWLQRSKNWNSSALCFSTFQGQSQKLFVQANIQKKYYNCKLTHKLLLQKGCNIVQHEIMSLLSLLHSVMLSIHDSFLQYVFLWVQMKVLCWDYAMGKYRGPPWLWTSAPWRWLYWGYWFHHGLTGEKIFPSKKI